MTPAGSLTPLSPIQRRSARRWLIALLLALGALLACDTINAIVGNPVFTCASSTPRPTDTPYPTSTPDFPWTFSANVDHYNYFMPLGQSFATVTVQYMAQSTSAVQLSYVGYDFGMVVLDSNGYFTINNAPPGQPGVYGTFTVFLPSYVTGAYIDVEDSVQHVIFSLYVYPNNTTSDVYNPPPCCLSNPIYPTPVPTYTPYPTPTLYSLTNDFYVGDTTYTSSGTAKIGVTLLSINVLNGVTSGPVFEWVFQVTNVGPIEYDFYDYFQSYVSQVQHANGVENPGLWPADLNLAAQLNIPIDVLPVAIMPGQSQAFIFVADGFQPGDQPAQIAFSMDPLNYLPGSTPTPYPTPSSVVTFLNLQDPYCSIPIASPTTMPTQPTPATPVP